MAVLEVRGVTKIYKGKGLVTAAKDVTFEVNKGEIVGFIGQNGAGKSTTIKIITGLAEATSGSVKINGFDVKTERKKALEKVGCIVENPDLYVDWSAVKNLEYFAALNPVEGGKDALKARIDELMRLVGLYDRRNDLVRRYSLGMKQRAGIAQALLSRPDLLILDEPTNGLDPAGIKEIRDLLLLLAHKHGLAILVSSHLLAEVQQTCDRFVIIQRGEVKGVYSKEDVEKKTGDETVLTTDDVDKAKTVLSAILGIEAADAGDGKVSFRTDLPVSEVTKALIQSDVAVLGIGKRGATLEDFFMDVTEKGANQ